MIEDQNEQVLHRIRKLEKLRAIGIDPYGRKFDISHTAKRLLRENEKKDAKQLESDPIPCCIAGRILSLRRFGKAGFAHLQDVTDRIQIYLKKDTLGEDSFAIVELLDIGDIIGIEGNLFRTKTGELTVQVKKLSLLAKSLRPLPEKWHGLSDVEIRYRQRYLDLISNSEARKVFIRRTKILKGIRSFLDHRGFLEVETPMMHPIPGGAAARPFVTRHNALGMDLYLRIAPELYLKRLIVGGLERVYEINRNFRNEGISTVHNPEFTMLEFYLAYEDYQSLMTLTEEMIGSVAQDTLGQLHFQYDEHKIDLTPPWKRIKFTEAILETNQIGPEVIQDPNQLRSVARKLGGSSLEDQPIGKILQEIFERTVEPTLIQPTFVTEYPTDISPLAKRKTTDPSLTDRFELFIAGLEIANGFSELNDPQDQRQRFDEQVRKRAAGDQEAHPMDEDFLKALEHGMPPAAGEGIGIDRLVMLLTNQTSIREVIFFPQLRPEAK